MNKGSANDPEVERIKSEDLTDDLNIKGIGRIMSVNTLNGLLIKTGD